MVPTYETKPDFLRQMILSVMDQTYKNWELCIADGSKTQKVKSVILSMHGNEDRIK